MAVSKTTTTTRRATATSLHHHAHFHHPQSKVKRSIKLIPAEKENGNTEYKRQVYNPTASRLRSLATQMSYRLDEGMGRCLYQIGVEDDGCHSLLEYESIAETARVLECIARSLNSVVLERTMIQREVWIGQDGEAELVSGDGDGNNGKEGSETIVVVKEPPLFRFSSNRFHFEGEVAVTEDGGEDEKEEKSEGSAGSSMSRIRKGKGFLTRCELVIQRVETHLLDPSPVSLAKLVSNLNVHSHTHTPNDNHHNHSNKNNNYNDNHSNKNNDNNNNNKNNNDDGNNNNNNNNNNTSNNNNDNNNRSNNNNDNNNTSNNNNGNESSSTPSPPFSPSTMSISETLSSRNIRVAVVGNVDAGKSTLIGTLTTSSLDDGRGSSRTSIMKHRHEIESGRTSTATTHLMGFRHTGQPIAGRDTIRANKRKSEDEIVRESYRIVTLMDLAGHERYLKTTIHGVSSGMADYSLILVNSRHPPTHMTQHHLNLCCSFGIPVIVVFTKIDNCPDHALKNSKLQLNKLLRASDVNKKPYAVRNDSDIATCIGKLHTLAPIIETSCVTGEGIHLLQKILFSLPKRRKHETKVQRPFEFLVEDIFNVPGVGAVVSGFVNAGELSVGSNCQVYVGPTDDGTFLKTIAKSAHVARINTHHITSGQSACLAFSLKKDDRLKLRRGMVVLQHSPTSTKQFDAEICVLKGEGTTIRRSYQAYVHILNVRQSAFARNIEIVNTNAVGLPPSHAAHRDEVHDARVHSHGHGHDDDDGIVLRPGSRAKVRFEFAKRPEYIRPGMRMLFRDGRVRGVGIITGIPQLPAVGN